MKIRKKIHILLLSLSAGQQVFVILFLIKTIYKTMHRKVIDILNKIVAYFLMAYLNTAYSCLLSCVLQILKSVQTKSKVFFSGRNLRYLAKY